MKVNYMRPGSTFGENYYEPYGDVSPKCNSDLDNKVATFSDATDVPDSDKFTVDNDLNDGDDLTPGDKCGYREATAEGIKSLKSVRYFYAMDASSHTKKDLKDFPLNSSRLGLDGDEESGKLVEDSEGISATSTQTPYFFYFGLVPGKTALDKLNNKYFADIFNEDKIENFTGEEDSDGDSGDGSQIDGDEESANALIGSCIKN
jgi:hypothetical protein